MKHFSAPDYRPNTSGKVIFRRLLEGVSSPVHISGLCACLLDSVMEEFCCMLPKVVSNSMYTTLNNGIRPPFPASVVIFIRSDYNTVDGRRF